LTVTSNDVRLPGWPLTLAVGTSRSIIERSSNKIKNYYLLNIQVRIIK
jgi:hypothetical protein